MQRQRKILQRRRKILQRQRVSLVTQVVSGGSLKSKMSNSFIQDAKALPILGVGLGLRRELADETFANQNKIDWLEIVPENYMNLGGAIRERLDVAREKFPLVTHGVSLSLGSTDELSCEYVGGMKRFLDLIDAPWWSDHLCFSSVNQSYMHDLLPLPHSKEAVEHLAKRIKQAQSIVGRPFLLENISYYMNVPETAMSEWQFLSEVVEKADCGILLDVNNIYVNSVNHKFDPYLFIDNIPLERVIQIHVAGHGMRDDVIIDTHGSAVIEPVFALLEYVLKRSNVKAVMLERDQNYPDFEELLSELARIRAIAESAQPALNMVA